MFKLIFFVYVLSIWATTGWSAPSSGIAKVNANFARPGKGIGAGRITRSAEKEDSDESGVRKTRGLIAKEISSQGYGNIQGSLAPVDKGYSAGRATRGAPTQVEDSKDDKEGGRKTRGLSMKVISQAGAAQDSLTPSDKSYGGGRATRDTVMRENNAQDKATADESLSSPGKSYGPARVTRSASTQVEDSKEDKEGGRKTRGLSMKVISQAGGAQDSLSPGDKGYGGGRVARDTIMKEFSSQDKSTADESLSSSDKSYGPARVTRSASTQLEDSKEDKEGGRKTRGITTKASSQAGAAQDSLTPSDKSYGGGRVTRDTIMKEFSSHDKATADESLSSSGKSYGPVRVTRSASTQLEDSKEDKESGRKTRSITTKASSQSGAAQDSLSPVDKSYSAGRVARGTPKEVENSNDGKSVNGERKTRGISSPQGNANIRRSLTPADKGFGGERKTRGVSGPQGNANVEKSLTPADKGVGGGRKTRGISGPQGNGNVEESLTPADKGVGTGRVTRCAHDAINAQGSARATRDASKQAEESKEDKDNGRKTRGIAMEIGAQTGANMLGSLSPVDKDYGPRRVTRHAEKDGALC